MERLRSSDKKQLLMSSNDLLRIDIWENSTTFARYSSRSLNFIENMNSVKQECNLRNKQDLEHHSEKQFSADGLVMRLTSDNNATNLLVST